MKCQVCGFNGLNGVCENADDNGESQECSGACAYGQTSGMNGSVVARLCDPNSNIRRGCLSGFGDEVSGLTFLKL